MNYLFSNYANFKGRTNRHDFWIAILDIVALCILVGLIMGVLDVKNVVDVTDSMMETAGFIISVVFFLPLWSLQVRRLHDINMSGWWILLNLTVVGSIVLFLFYCKKSVDENKY